MEAQRNAMEAARKRAEEEEAKRKKHLEELSLIPDDKLDKQYMDALAKGDDATAREMLDEAARRKGYDDTESAYQGVGAWAAPGNPGYESDKARRDDWESSGSDVNLEDMALGYTPQPDDYFSHPERYSQNTPHGLESVKAINTAIDAIKNGEKDVKVKVYRAVPTSVKEGSCVMVTGLLLLRNMPKCTERTDWMANIVSLKTKFRLLNCGGMVMTQTSLALMMARSINTRMPRIIES